MRELALPETFKKYPYGDDTIPSHQREVEVRYSADDDPAKSQYIDEKLRRMRAKWRKV